MICQNPYEFFVVIHFKGQEILRISGMIFEGDFKSHSRIIVKKFVQKRYLQNCKKIPKKFK